MKKLLKMFPKGETLVAWKMDKKHLEEYYKDPEIKIFKFSYKTHSWWK
jgi:hypothetical protein